MSEFISKMVPGNLFHLGVVPIVLWGKPLLSMTIKAEGSLLAWRLRREPMVRFLRLWDML